MSKAETRGITQPYILALQLISLSILALTHSAIFNAQFWLLWALTLPAVLLGSSAGVALYRRMRGQFPARGADPVDCFRRQPVGEDAHLRVYVAQNKDRI